MSKFTFEAIRGVNDILPESSPYWQWLEALCRQIAERYSYREIRLPLLEPTALFKRTIGEDTDIVSKEMYTFEDRNGESVTLRPEGTAGCVRAGIERNLLYNQIQRLWYLGPMFRREKPQKGRYRQFYQFGLEAFGMSGPNIDAELIVMGQRLWEALGIQDQVRLEINSLGTPDSRAAYRIALKAYFQAHYNDLDTDSQRRLETNPLRILDSKVASMQTLIESAPCLTGYLDEASRAHFDGLCAQLDALGVSYRINPHLVRGLDYYSFTVFEWITDALGAQGTVCAGGRYDVLVEQLGGKPTPAVGLAMGLERLILLIEQTQRLSVSPDIYGVCIGDAAMQMGLVLAERLRYALPHLHIEMDCAGGSMKAQFKRADKRGADYAVVLGDTEIAAGQVTLKPLRKQADQQTLTENELISYLSTLSNEHHKPNSLRAIGDEHE